MNGLPRLRPYQAEALRQCGDAMRDGSRAPLIVIPTGGGKTITAAYAVAQAVSRKKRVVWLTHRRELLRQSVDTLVRFGLHVGALGVHADAPVQVCSVQALTRRGEAPPADLVVFDEARHFAADDWYRLYSAYESVYRLGLDATPERGDGRGLAPIFDRIIVGATYNQLRALNEEEPTKGLVSCEIVKPSRPVRSKKLAQDPKDAYLQYASNRKCVLFAPNVKSAESFAESLQDAGISSSVVHGDLSKSIRDDRLEAFRVGETKVVCNVQVLTEGWDCPSAEVAIIARRVGTAGLWLQMIGRVLRPSPGKRSALVIDLTGASDEFGGPDTEWEYSLEGVAIRRAGAGTERFCKVCSGLLSPDGRCPSCGYEPAETEVPTSEGIALEKFAGMRALPDSRRATTLAKWLKTAREKGHKEASVAHKYKAVFGHWPPAQITQAARRMIA